MSMYDISFINVRNGTLKIYNFTECEVTVAWCMGQGFRSLQSDQQKRII